MTDDDLIHGEIARALTLAGLAFSSDRIMTTTGNPVRVFNLSFDTTDQSAKFLVTAYVAGSFFIVQSPICPLEEGVADLMSDSLVHSVPMTRLVRDKFESKPGAQLYWVEATSVVPRGAWDREAHIIASTPIFVVSSGIGHLLEKFPQRAALPPETPRMPIVDITPSDARALPLAGT